MAVPALARHTGKPMPSPQSRQVTEGSFSACRTCAGSRAFSPIIILASVA